MRPTNRLVIPVLAVVAMSACDGQTPTGPTSSAPTQTAATPTPPATTPFHSWHVTGLVLDSANIPVDGASLTFWTNPPLMKTSDAGGAYDVTLKVPIAAQPSSWVTVEKAGY